MGKITVDIILPQELLDKALPILEKRDLELSAFVAVHLQGLVTGAKANRPLALADEMPLGKYKGAVVEDIIRADPKYIAWLLGNAERFGMDTEATELLNELLA